MSLFSSYGCTMKSAAIYARYSSDKQSETSIEDQIALCREFAARNAFEIVSVYSDAAKSGSSLFGRSGLLIPIVGCADSFSDSHVCGAVIL